MFCVIEKARCMSLVVFDAGSLPSLGRIDYHRNPGYLGKPGVPSSDGKKYATICWRDSLLGGF
jgi:hypothetical protein